jgi:hypothetical protein
MIWFTFFMVPSSSPVLLANLTYISACSNLISRLLPQIPDSPSHLPPSEAHRIRPIFEIFDSLRAGQNFREEARDKTGQGVRCLQARPAGFEPAAYGFEARRSIQLSYGRKNHFFLTAIPGFVNNKEHKICLTKAGGPPKYLLFYFPGQGNIP